MPFMVQDFPDNPTIIIRDANGREAYFEFHAATTKIEEVIDFFEHGLRFLGYDMTPKVLTIVDVSTNDVN